MTGTAGQIEWAVEIRKRAGEEFDRVAAALRAAERNGNEAGRGETDEILAILEGKRAEVMANDRAGYFIVEWQELRDQVRQLIGKDPRYEAIRSRRKPTGS